MRGFWAESTRSHTHAVTHTHTHTHTRRHTHTHTNAKCRTIDLLSAVVEKPSLALPPGWDTQSAADMLLLNCPWAPFQIPVDSWYWFWPFLPSASVFFSASIMSPFASPSFFLNFFTRPFVVLFLVPRGNAAINKRQASLLLLFFFPFLFFFLWKQQVAAEEEEERETRDQRDQRPERPEWGGTRGGKSWQESNLVTFLCGGWRKHCHAKRWRTTEGEKKYWGWYDCIRAPLCRNTHFPHAAISLS